MTAQFLGWEPLVVRGVGTVWRPVFVVWLPDATQPIAAQLPECLQCGHCHASHALEALAARRDLMDHRVRSVSMTCSCGAAVHFDKTPPAARARLRWTRTFQVERPEGAT